MNGELLTNALTLLDGLAVVILLFCLVYLFVIKQRRRYERLSEDEVRVVEAEAKASSIIHQGVKTAQKMIVRAELEGISLLSKLKLQSNKIENDQREQVRLLFEEMKAKSQTQTQRASDSYENYLGNLQKSLEADLNRKQQNMEVKVDQLFDHTQSLLTSFVANLESRTKTQVDEQIGQARTVIDQYRQKRLEIVDENIVGILEKTLSITLGKKLSLSDQTQLIYEALEEAKKENIFV